MPNIGFPELIVILVIVLLLFGPKKLPDFARSMGQAIREFRRASQEVMDDFQRVTTEEPKPATTAKSSPSHEEEAPAAVTASVEKPAQEPTTTKQL